MHTPYHPAHGTPALAGGAVVVPVERSANVEDVLKLAVGVDALIQPARALQVGAGVCVCVCVCVCARAHTRAGCAGGKCFLRAIST